MACWPWVGVPGFWAAVALQFRADALQISFVPAPPVQIAPCSAQICCGRGINRGRITWPLVFKAVWRGICPANLSEDRKQAVEKMAASNQCSQVKQDQWQYWSKAKKRIL